MMNCETVKAYAKINFGLRVLPKREDGFHNLESIFQTINLYDELKIIQTDTNVCEVYCKELELPLENTLTLAYKAFCEITDVKVPGVMIELTKGIPSGGGLGGGSSDATALIRVLEKLCKVKLTKGELDYIAGKTGSDVFFFMHCDSDGTGCAVVTGRGEYIQAIKPRKDLWLVLLFPKVKSSTKEAYSLIDEYLLNNTDSNHVLYDDLEKVYNLPIQEWSFKNTFTIAIANKYKEIGNAIDSLYKCGCCYAEMSGSGSTVFGVFTLKQQAMDICNLLAGTWNSCVVQVV